MLAVAAAVLAFAAPAATTAPGETFHATVCPMKTVTLWTKTIDADAELTPRVYINGTQIFGTLATINLAVWVGKQVVVTFRQRTPRAPARWRIANVGDYCARVTLNYVILP